MASDNDFVLKQKWRLRTPLDLAARRAEIGSTEFLIDGFFPSQSLGIVVGDSGLGKSPLLYQMALCIAAGVPFLGRRVQQGKVLYLDFENSVSESAQVTTRLAGFLSVGADQPNLLVWNFSDSAPDWGQGQGTGALSCILDVRPALAIIDSLGSYDPEIEEKNTTAGRAYKRFRQLMHMANTGMISIHHRKKPSIDEPEHLEDAPNVLRWLLRARGASTLISGSDVRLGVDQASATYVSAKEPTGKDGLAPVDFDDAESHGAALVLRGFARVRGEIGPIYLERVVGDDGEPLGYKRMAGAALLFNQDQQRCFNQLPDRFSFKEARGAYGRQAEATRSFLNKCRNIGIMHQPARGIYEKVKTAE